jgi:sulfite reductase alpha subunit-like flavoprotein
VNAYVLYGSETGKAEQLARKLKVAVAGKLATQIFALDDFDTQTLISPGKKMVFIVSSTFGSGQVGSCGGGAIVNFF